MPTRIRRLIYRVFVVRTVLGRHAGERIEGMGVRILDLCGILFGRRSGRSADRLGLERRGDIRGGAGQIGSGEHAGVGLHRRHRHGFVARLTLRGFLLLDHRRRGGRRQGLEQIGVLDQPRRQTVARHDHVVADRRDLEQLRREGEGQADAAMRGGIAGHDARVQRRAGPGDPVHPRHRRAAIEVGVMMPVLLENTEHAGLGGVAAHSR